MEGLHCTNCKPMLCGFKKYVLIITVDVLLSFFILLRVSFLDVYVHVWFVFCTYRLVLTSPCIQPCCTQYLWLHLPLSLLLLEASLHQVLRELSKSKSVIIIVHVHFWLSLNVFDSFLGFC